MSPEVLFLRIAARRKIPFLVMSTRKTRAASDARAEWYAALQDNGMSLSAISRLADRDRTVIRGAIHRLRTGAEDRRKHNGGKA